MEAQPIPVELLIGNKYGSVNVVFNKTFSETLRIGLFHLNMVQFDMGDEKYNSFILQDQLYIETFKNLRVAGGKGNAVRPGIEPG